ncbi:MAG: DegT/DnrJ/EryC1/StrS family aminotransferase [Nitrososphaerales archaeon]
MRSHDTSHKPIPSMKPFIPEEDIKALLEGYEEIIRSGKLTLGEYTEKFEREFARYTGVKFAVAANSGTCTLEMIYRSLGVDGKEVITPTNTHIATSNAVIFAGGRPILAEMDASSLCIDVEDAFSRITEKTRALVIVHIAGLIHPQMDEIRERCSKLGIEVIEDAAHAHGATRYGRKAGCLSRAASFSFYPAKVITSVEGGMITTDDEEIAEKARSLRNHGSDKNGLQVMLGYNWRMSEVHSLLGLSQLRRIEQIIQLKTRVARIYESSLSGVDELSLISLPSKYRHSYYKYPVVLGDRIDPIKVRNTLKTKYGIETGSIYYPPCHLQPIYSRIFGYKLGDFPIAEDTLARTITLPIFAGMEVADATYVVDNLLTTLKLEKASI